MITKQLLDPREKILWSGQPVCLPYVFHHWKFLLVGLLWGLFDLGFFMFFQNMGGVFPEIGEPIFFRNFQFLFLALHSLPFWVALASPFLLLIRWKTVHYVLTDQRLYLESGIIGRDVTALTMPEITGLHVQVDLIERLSDTGSLQIKSQSSTHHTLAAISNPYEVFQLLRSLSLDVTSDIYYPNELRPHVNPGYRSEYQPQDRP